MDDNKKIFICLEDINPFVRLSGFYPRTKISPDWKQAYDCRLTYICDGEGTIDVEEYSYVFNKGDLFFWLPGNKYRMITSDKNPMEIINICFDFTQDHKHIRFAPPQTIEEFNYELITEIPQLTDVEAFNGIMHLQHCQYLEVLMKEISSEYSIQKKYSTIRLNGMLMSLLGLIARHNAEIKGAGGKSQSIVDSIIDYIHNHLKEDLSNQNFAAMFNFHPVHINRLFLKHTGTSLHQYVQNVRLQKAVTLLSLSALSVSEASDAVGFNDPNYFSKLFKQKLGKCPSEI